MSPSHYIVQVVTNEGLTKGLDQEQRNLLSVAYKNVVGARRASWRVLEQIMKSKGKESTSDMQRQYAAEYQSLIEKELDDICNDVLNLLTTQLLKRKKNTPEENVFYFKMKGDYHRYMAEYQREDSKERSTVIASANHAYEEALQAAKSLAATDPIRLGLALNFSVFYYEIQNAHGKACALAKDAFDTAVTQLEALTEEQYKDATLIMQLLRDNLTLWQSEGEEESNSRVEKDGTTFENI
eukprot:g5384.t1